MAKNSDTTLTEHPATARVFIYTLADPETGEIRYVGKAIDLNKRLRTHSSETIEKIRQSALARSKAKQSELFA